MRFFIGVFLSILFLSQNLLAQAAFKTVRERIIKAEEQTATVPSNPYVPVGSSGVVIREFDDEHESIIAKAIVEEKNEKEMKIRFKPFDMLKQDALPTPKIKPRKGDKVILNYLYDRAFVIVPNEESYLEVLSQFPAISWIHPDILAAFLSKEYNPQPSKEDFQKVCNKNASMLLFFAIGDKGYFVDCNTFKIIKETPFDKKDSKEMVPFYSRIGEIESNIFDLTKGKIENYETYYKKLLGIEK